MTGGTGTLGQNIVKRLLSGELGYPARIIIFSRDEAKQYDMRLSLSDFYKLTNGNSCQEIQQIVNFKIGDIRDYYSVLDAVREVDIIIHAAALKQVPTCEYFPFQSVQTNILGVKNIVQAVKESRSQVQVVIGISTDKACKPINVMGMTKALMERILIEANLEQPQTRFICVRYGNVIASRGSAVPLFLEQINRGGPVTITTRDMTRFLLSLETAIDTLFAAMEHALPGEIYVPQLCAARVLDVAKALMNGTSVPIRYTGMRPGEKIHEIMISEEECYRTIERDGYFVICPMLPEIGVTKLDGTILKSEYTSAHVTMGEQDLRELLAPYLTPIQPKVALCES